MEIGLEGGLEHTEISVCSHRASGVMALLLGGVDVDVIKIIGRWRSNKVLCYLHTSARSITHNHATVMR